jgi:hypothetical protein
VGSVLWTIITIQSSTTCTSEGSIERQRFAETLIADRGLSIRNTQEDILIARTIMDSRIRTVGNRNGGRTLTRALCDDRSDSSKNE